MKNKIYSYICIKQYYNTMKRIIYGFTKAILYLICIISLCLSMAEAPTAGKQVAWTLGWLAVLFVCAKILERIGAFKDMED